MKKSAKFALITFIIAGLLVACFVGISRLLAPAFIKAELSQQVYQLTGHSLVINGDVHWSFFPWLGIKVQQVVINNVAEFGQTPFAKADDVQLNVKLIPLFSSRLEVGNILIDGLHLYLIKKPNGQTNWDHLRASFSSQKNLTSKQEDNANIKKFEIKSISVKQGKISFNNAQKHTNVELNALNLDAKNVSLYKPFDFNLSFSFKKQPSFSSGDMKLNGTLNIDSSKDALNFSGLTFESNFQDAKEKKSTLKASCNLIYEEKNTQFSITQLTARLNNYAFSGDLSGTLIPTLSAYGHLQSTLLLMGGLPFKNVQTHINIKNAIVSLNSLTANLYEGNYTGDILIDTNPVTPVVTLNGALIKADVSALFSGVMRKNYRPFTGTVDISTMLKFTGDNADSMRKTLNGNMSVQLQNGVLHGINIPALIELGQAIIKQEALPNMANNQTDFGTLKGTFQIRNGVMFNQDLILQSSQLAATGQGKIDLVNEQINYHLNAGLVGHKMRIPIAIRGNMNHPVVAPDTQQIIKITLDEKTDNLKDKLKDKLKEKFGGELKKLNLESLFG